MAGSFGVNYNAGGVVDEVKKVKLINEVEQVDNLANVEVVEDVKLVEEVTLVDEVAKVDDVVLVETVNDVVLVETVNDVKMVDEVGHIRGFATKTKPYNTMEMYDIPAIIGNYEFDFILPGFDIEIMAITLTCSGYGEDDHYDLFFNGDQWFKDWYCSEVKEGLFLGTSTYIYAAPPASTIHLVFKNDSGTAKKVWMGVRMLT